MIGEDDTIDTYDFYDYGDDHSEQGDMDFLEVELVRSKLTPEQIYIPFSASCLKFSYLLSSFSSYFLLIFLSGKSDSVLAMADATLDHLDHDALFLCHLEPSIFAERLSPHHGTPPRMPSFFSPDHDSSHPRLASIRRSSSTGSEDLLRPHHANHHTHAPMPKISRLSAFLQEMENDDGQEALLNNQLNEQHTLNGRLMASVTNANRGSSDGLSSKGQAHRAGMIKG